MNPKSKATAGNADVKAARVDPNQQSLWNDTRTRKKGSDVENLIVTEVDERATPRNTNGGEPCRLFWSLGSYDRNLGTGLCLITQYKILCLNTSVDERCGQLE